MTYRFIWADGRVLIGSLTKGYGNHHGGMLDKAVAQGIISGHPEDYVFGHFSEDELHGGQFPTIDITSVEGDVPTTEQLIADIRDELSKGRHISKWREAARMKTATDIIELANDGYLEASHIEGHQPWIYSRTKNAFFILEELEGHHEDITDRMEEEGYDVWEDAYDSWTGEFLYGDGSPDKGNGDDRVMIYKDFDAMNAADFKYLPTVVECIHKVWPGLPIYAFQSAAQIKVAAEEKVRATREQVEKSFTFVWIDGHLITGQTHHQALMAALINAGWTWEDLMNAPQAWGWHSTTSSAMPNTISITFASDAGTMTDVDGAINAFRELGFNVDTIPLMGGGARGVDEKGKEYGQGMRGREYMERSYLGPDAERETFVTSPVPTRHPKEDVVQ